MSSIFWWTFLLVRFIFKVISYITLCKIELSPKGDRKKFKRISYVKLKMSSMSKFRIFMVDGGWCPTFWFFKSLDNNMVYVKEIRVFWGRSPEARGDLKPPRAPRHARGCRPEGMVECPRGPKTRKPKLFRYILKTYRLTKKKKKDKRVRKTKL